MLDVGIGQRHPGIYGAKRSEYPGSPFVNDELIVDQRFDARLN